MTASRSSATSFDRIEQQAGADTSSCCDLGEKFLRAGSERPAALRTKIGLEVMPAAPGPLVFVGCGLRVLKKMLDSIAIFWDRVPGAHCL